MSSMKPENWEIRRKKDKKTKRHRRQKRKEEMFQGARARGKIDLQVVARDAETTDSLIARAGQGQIVAIAGDKQRPRTRGLAQIQDICTRSGSMKSTSIYKCTYVVRYMSKKKGQIHNKREREADRDIETCE